MMQDVRCNPDQVDRNGIRNGVMVALAVGLGFAVALACAPKPDAGVLEGCPPCQTAGDMNWNCLLDIKFQAADQYAVVCAPDNDASIDAACNTACAEWSAGNEKPCVGWVNNHETYACLDTPPSTDGDPVWEPGDFVFYAGGVYHVDVTLADQLRGDASLLGNDAAYLQWVASAGYWQFRDVYAGSLAYELGFRTNDYVRKVNGTTVQSLQTVLHLLHQNYEASSFTVEIKRGANIYTYSYVIE